MTEPKRRDRPIALLAWYRSVQHVTTAIWMVRGGIRCSGAHHMPDHGGVLLVSNHLSHLDVFFLGLPLNRPLNYVARSTLFIPVLGPLIRSVGGFAIQRDGRGAQGLKETLKRLKGGAIVTIFPEGTRTPDGELGEMKAGVAILASRASVPIVPAALAGSFEAWPRGVSFPKAHPVHIHYGKAIQPEELAGLDFQEITNLIRDRILDCQREARRQLAFRWGRDEDRTASARTT
jgi:1-acyl-sn-glycerol-3-phosphate acyltransferase